MRQKWLDEITEYPWFIFGELDGKVDVATPNYSTLVGQISKEEAERLIKFRDDLQEILYVMVGKSYKKYEKIYDIIQKLKGG